MRLHSSWRVTRLIVRLGLVGILLVSSLAVLGLGASAQSVSWRAEFFNNVDLSGAPVLVRDDAGINFNWGTGSPGSGVSADNFSVRWTTYAYFGAGDYTFSLTVDDGGRLWIDDQVVIDQWRDQAPTTFTAVRNLSAGYHSLRVEYYERTGGALAQLSWASGSAPPATGDWRGEYFNNSSLSGTPALVRNDLAIDFNWGYGSPSGGINADMFSVRWTRDVAFPSSGNYTFSATVDDGVRVWVAGTLIIDKWIRQAPTTHQGTLYLPAGTHQVRIEYFEDTGAAQCRVSWTAGGGSTPSAQEVIIDNKSAGFTWGGPAGSWYSRAYGYGGQLNWTWNSRTQMYHWGRWTPSLSAGNWEVYVYIASKYFGSKSAKYQVFHSGVRNDIVVNQNNYYNQWVSLGTYAFSGGGGEYVFLSDVTGEAYATRYLGFDAVKFVRRDGGTTPPPPSTGCSIVPVLGFGRIWNGYTAVRNKIGCATELEKSTWAAEQTFQGGRMFWRQDSKTIYVLYNSGTWASYPDTWSEGQQEWDPSIVPPSGYYQPKRGFGTVWRNNASVRSGLGWATTEEVGFQGAAQTFQSGQMLWSALRGVHVLYNDGRWERYN
ncbi:MAG: PA14 domain-containing protein [Anaerolineae bacterium]